MANMALGLDVSLRQDDDFGAPAVDSRQSMDAALYEVGIRGRLSATLVCALDGFDVVSSDRHETRLRGWVVDQSSLYGVIETISSLGLELISVSPVRDPPMTSPASP
jgi:hypothetical protein